MTDMPTSPEPSYNLPPAPVPAMGPSGPSAQRLTSDQRQTLLAQTISSQVATGMRVESQGPFSAILVKGKPVNHILHLLITLFTLGLWVVVWIVMAVVGGEKRSQVSVDDFGNVTVQKLT